MTAAFSGAARQTAWSVFVKTALLAVAIVLFFLLRGMHAWHDEFAPSARWIRELRARAKPWSAPLASAAELLPHEQTYRDANALFVAIFDQVESLPTPAAGSNEPLAKYLADVAALKATRDSSRAEAETLQTRFAEDKAHERALEEKLTDAKSTLEAKKNRRRKSKAAIDEATAAVKSVAKEQEQLAKEMAERTSRRRLSEEWNQRRIADLETRVESAKKAMRAEFDAVRFVARPVPSWLQHETLSQFLLIVGDANDSLHGIYTAVWYGLELLVAFLIYLVLRPMVIALAGSTDGKKLFELVKKGIAGSFSTAGRAAGNVLIGATAAGLALVATSQLVGDPLHTELPPPVIEEVHTVSSGEKGVKGDQGDPGNPGKSVIPDELKVRLAQLEEARLTLQQTIEEVRGTAVTISEQLDQLQQQKLPSRVGDLEVAAGATETNLQILGQVSGSLTKVTAALAKVDSSIVAQQTAIESSVAAQLPKIASSAADASSFARQANENAQKATAKAGEYAEEVDHLLDQGTFWDDRGFWGSLIPLQRYAAGPAAIHLVDHDLCQRKVPDEARRVVTAAMADASTEQRYRWAFRRKVLDSAVVRVRAGEATVADVEQAIRATMPLIMKVSRVPR
jgi:hypothetical protein